MTSKPSRRSGRGRAYRPPLSHRCTRARSLALKPQWRSQREPPAIWSLGEACYRLISANGFLVTSVTERSLRGFGPQRKAALRFIFTKSLFARLQTQPFFPRLKSCGSAAGPTYQQRETEQIENCNDAETGRTGSGQFCQGCTDFGSRGHAVL